MPKKLVTRGTIAKILAGIFVLNLVVMGAGAVYTYQKAPEIPDTVVGPEGETVATAEQDRLGKVQIRDAPPLWFRSTSGAGTV